MDQSKTSLPLRKGQTISKVVTSERVWYLLLALVSLLFGVFLLVSPWPEVVPALTLALIVGLTFFFHPYLGVLTYIVLGYMRFEDMILALRSLHLTKVLAIALILVWVVRAAITKPKLHLQEKGLVLFYLLVLMIALSIPFSFWPTRSFASLTDILRTLVFTFLFISLIDTEKKIKTFFWVFLIVNGFLAVSAIRALLLWGQAGVLARIGTGEGFLEDANDFALALSVVLPFSFYLFLAEKRKKRKFLFLVFFVLFTLGIIATASRGGFVTLVFLFLYFILKSKHKLVGVFSIVLLFFLIFVFAPREYWQRQMTITSYQQDESAMGRIHAWKAGLSMFADRPLLGVGVGAYETAYGVKYGGKSGPWFAPHNTYVQIGAETGFFGLLFYLALMFYIYRQSTLLSRSYAEGRYLKSVSQGLTAALLAYAVGSFFLSVAYYPHLYLLLAIAVSVKILKEKEQAEA